MEKVIIHKKFPIRLFGWKSTLEDLRLLHIKLLKYAAIDTPVYELFACHFMFIPGYNCEDRIGWWRTVSELRYLITVLTKAELLPENYRFLSLISMHFNNHYGIPINIGTLKASKDRNVNEDFRKGIQQYIVTVKKNNDLDIPGEIYNI